MNEDKLELTPVMQQYMAIKNEYKDCIVFYRLGDFYEMFFEDAHIASKVLELTLTGRNCGQCTHVRSAFSCLGVLHIKACRKWIQGSYM